MKLKVLEVHTKSKEQGRPGLPKESREEIVVTRTGADGDYNHYRATRKDNTPDRALLLFPVETIGELVEEGWDLSPGDLGENVTTQGIPQDDMFEGMRLGIGEVEVELTERCNPCRNLSAISCVGEDRVEEFIDTVKGRRGWYARVLREGTIRRGDPISVLR